MASLRTKVETALTGVLAATTTNVYAGLAYSNKELPCVIAAVKSIEDVLPLSGRYIATCEIIVEDTAAVESTFDDICEAVRVIVDAAGFTASLITADLHVYGTAESSRVEYSANGDSWVETRTIQIECAPTA